jgi:hypothetical protein
MGRYQDLPNRTDVYYVDDSQVTTAGSTLCRQRRVCNYVGGMGYPRWCINASCCYQFTVPEGVTHIVIEAWGAGGSGGSAADCCCCQATPGGGGGGYASATVSTCPGEKYTVCVGGGAEFPYGMVCQVGTPCSGSVPGCGCAGGLTFVTGPGLENFCATPGCGGCAMCNSYFSCNGTNQPNYGCGVVAGSRVTCGITTRGMGGTSLGCSGNGCRMESYGGNGGGPAGGTGGVRGWMNCCRCFYPGMPGQLPGGGGSGVIGSDNCAACNCGGAGAPGLVKIWY